MKITASERWDRDAEEYVPCFRFTREDGSSSTCDMMDDDQFAEFHRQEAEREPASGVEE